MKSAIDILKRYPRTTKDWQILAEPIHWYGGIAPAGTEYKVKITTNFGFLVLRTAVAGRRFFQY